MIWDMIGDAGEDGAAMNSSPFDFCALVCVLPISFFQTLDSLKFTSTMSLILIYCLAVGIILYAQGVFDACESHGGDTHYYHDGLVDDGIEQVCKGSTVIITDFDDTVKNLAIFVFSFTCFVFVRNSEVD